MLVWLKDRQGRFVMADRTFVEAAGRPCDEILGKNDLDIWPATLAEQYRADDAEASNGR